MIKKIINSNEKKVLSYFFTFPNKEDHIRGLSKKIKSPYPTVRNVLNKLEKNKLLKKREESKMIFFSVNKTKEFMRLKKLFNIQSLYDTGLVDELENKLKPDALVLFGSFLDGTDYESSDVDLAVINGRDTKIDRTKFENKLKRNIHLVNINDLKKEEKHFRNTAANGFVLLGNIEVV